MDKVDLSKVGVKYDKGKLDYSLLDLSAFQETVRALEAGAEKYEAYNWAKSDIGWERRYSAAIRHLTEALHDPLAVDPETGHRHIAHALTNLYFQEWWNERT